MSTKPPSLAQQMAEEIKAGRVVRLAVPVQQKKISEPSVPYVFTERECKEREEDYDDRVSRDLRRLKIW